MVDARTSLALWLRAGRTQRGFSLDDVARVTKIQSRILERLEAGKLDGLPADVFVRGFVRSFARCVGLDEAEALRRYAACGDPKTATPVGPAARAVIDAMADLVPNTARSAPRVLHDDPEASLELAAGSGSDWSPNTAPSPIVQIAEQLADVVAEPIIDPVAPGDAVVATPDPVVTETAAIVMAPPADVDLLAGESSQLGQAEPIPAKKKRTRKAAGTAAPKPRGKRKSMATGTPSEPTPIVATAVDVIEAAPLETAVLDTAMVVSGIVEAAATESVSVTAAVAVAPAAGIPDYEISTISAEALAFAAAGDNTATVTSIELETVDPAFGPDLDAERAVDGSDSTPESAGAWLPKMPPPSAASSAPWRRPGYVSTAPIASLVAVIDDADPDSAERELEDRRATKEPRRSFLPPILLDREDRSARQGGLTLAVIILLIAATLTLSYLMRRPSSSGDGVTRTETSAPFSAPHAA